MNNKLQVTLCLGGLCICFFGIILDTFFSYTMLLMKVIFIASGIFCGLGAIDSFRRFVKAYNRKNKETVYNLIFRSGYKCRIVNSLTIFRILACPLLLILLFNDNLYFKWILLLAFLTDALDGFFARRWKVTTKLGTKLDSLADDCLFVVSVISITYLHTDFIIDNLHIIVGILFIFFIKMAILMIKHKKFISGMHTYFTKGAAVLQAVFFLYTIFFNPNDVAFMIMITGTLIALAEEIIIISAFRELKQNIKGLFF